MQFELHIQRQMKSQAPTPGTAERTTFLSLGRGEGTGPCLARPLHLGGGDAREARTGCQGERDLRLGWEGWKEERDVE